MDEQRVMAPERCPNARFIFNALLPAHRLVFAGASAGSAFADAVPDPTSLVWGVVYDITDSDRKQLDARESVGGRAYRPKEVLVHPHGDIEQKVIVLTYGVGNAGDIQRPTRQYLDHLIRGAKRWGIPADYIATLERTETGTI